jgi:hypothetical protein
MDDWKLPGKETACPADPNSEPAVLAPVEGPLYRARVGHAGAIVHCHGNHAVGGKGSVPTAEGEIGSEDHRAVDPSPPGQKPLRERPVENILGRRTLHQRLSD